MARPSRLLEGWVASLYQYCSAATVCSVQVGSLSPANQLEPQTLYVFGAVEMFLNYRALDNPEAEIVWKAFLDNEDQQISEDVHIDAQSKTAAARLTKEKYIITEYHARSAD